MLANLVKRGGPSVVTHFGFVAPGFSPAQPQNADPALRGRRYAKLTHYRALLPVQPARVLDLEFPHLCCDFLGLARFLALSPLGERVGRPGVFFSPSADGAG